MDRDRFVRVLFVASALCAMLALALPLLAQQRKVFLPAVVSQARAEAELTPQSLRIVQVVLRGSGPAANSDEYVQIRNVGAAPIELSGLRLSGNLPLTPNGAFSFPAATLPPGGSALVFTKAGTNNPGASLFYLGSEQDRWYPLFRAELRDPQGRLLSSYTLGSALPPPPAPTALPTVTPFFGPIVQIIEIVLRDPAFPADTDEYVVITNQGGREAALAGWTLRNVTRGDQVPPYVFPAFTFSPDVTIAVFSRVGDDNPEIGDFFWDQQGDIWRVGDRAELRDAEGALVSSFVVAEQ